ncbi:MAG TPA: DNA-binding protein YbiB [Pararobbsia sp.]|nr:DNA-binding protein YbiB [Pararobbsia sp.]
MTESTFSCARFIKEIGRGPHGARPLSRDDAHDLYAAMLDGRVSDVELGAVLVAYRLKGETPVELSGMLAAAHATIDLLRTPAGNHRAVSIPTYNGARKQANLTPLLAMLLAREGVPVLVHGVTDDPGRVTSAEIFAELGVAAASNTSDIERALDASCVAFAPIATLSPRLARLLSMRRVLGVRNSTHTLVKLLQPFADPGLRLVNYTHPPYRDNLSALFRDHPELGAGGALLARGTEGEAVADTRRQVQIDWLHDGVAETIVESERRADDAPLPVLPERDAGSTARWIEQVLAGTQAAPAEIQRQVEIIKRLAART